MSDELFSRKPLIMQLTGRLGVVVTPMNSTSVVGDDGNIIDGLGIVSSDNCPDNNARCEVRWSETITSRQNFLAIP